MRARAWWQPWVMVGPTAVLLGLFFVAPVLAAVVQSFWAWDMLAPPTYVGLTNYRRLAQTGELAQIALTTLRYSAMVVAGAMGLGLSLALLLDRPGRWAAAVRGAIFSAYVVSWVSVALLWSWLLDPDSGLVAGLLRVVGLPRVGFLTDPDTALATLAAVTVWKITGYAMIIFLVGLQDIPPALHEAAALDGAGPRARFQYVTWPLLRPTAAFVATASLIVSFQAFDVVRVMTQGGPVKATTLFVYAIYEQVFLDLRVGRASALTVVFLVLLLVLSGLQLWAFPGPSAGGAMKARWGPRLAANVLMGVAALGWLTPYAWMVLTSLKPLAEITASPLSPLPTHPTFGAYREVLTTIPVVRQLLTLTVVAVAIALARIALSLPAGYALAKLRFKGKNAVFALVLGCLLVPAQVTFVPVFLGFAALRLVNTPAALVLPFAVSAFGTFLVRQALLAVPDELIEAAHMDGAGETTIIYRILGPLLTPTLTSLFLLSFVFHWNDYFWPLVMTTDDEVRTLPLGVALFREQGTGVRWHLVMAANVVLSAPALALFALAQRHLLRAVAAR